MTLRVCILATLDTKASEVEFLAKALQTEGSEVLAIDASLGRAISESYSFSVITIEQFMPNVPLSALRVLARSEARALVEDALKVFLPKWVEDNRIAALVGIGGSQGSSLFCNATTNVHAETKLALISTLQGSHIKTRQAIKVIETPIDFCGVTPLNAHAFLAVCEYVCGKTCFRAEKLEQKPTVALSMYGSTDAGVKKVCAQLRQSGRDVAVFHAIGSGGRRLTDLSLQGQFEGIVDMTLGEISNGVLGGDHYAGPGRLSAPLEAGIPTVVCPGSSGTVVFARDKIPNGFLRSHHHVWHTDSIVVCRATPDETWRVGEEISRRINRAQRRVAVVVPTRGLDSYYLPGQALWDEEADKALFQALKTNLRPDISLKFIDAAIHEECFSEEVFRTYEDVLAGICSAQFH